jgi:hypothetical protein
MVPHAPACNVPTSGPGKPAQPRVRAWLEQRHLTVNSAVTGNASERAPKHVFAGRFRQAAAMLSSCVVFASKIAVGSPDHALTRKRSP